ncbi:MAG: hypothetical protein ACHQ16_00055 [Candidatus Lutacidiplasmatales archaeon]
MAAQITMMSPSMSSPYGAGMSDSGTVGGAGGTISGASCPGARSLASGSVVTTSEPSGAEISPGSPDSVEAVFVGVVSSTFGTISLGVFTDSGAAVAGISTSVLCTLVHSWYGERVASGG